MTERQYYWRIVAIAMLALVVVVALVVVLGG